MRMKFTATIAALVVAATTIAAVAPADAQWRHRHGGWGHHHRGGWGGGGAVIGGLAAGAIIGGALAAQRPYYGYGPGPVYYDADPGYYGGDAVGYCMQRFKSYDPRSGTYLGYDGYRHPCP
jgi:hypothetical protein